MMPALPPLNLSSSTSSKSGDISAPNTVSFGSFGAPTVAGGLGSWVLPVLAAGAAVMLLRRKK